MNLDKARQALAQRQAELAALVAERTENDVELQRLHDMPTGNREALGDWEARKSAAVARRRELRAAVIAKQGEIKEAEYDVHLAEHGQERPA